MKLMKEKENIFSENEINEYLWKIISFGLNFFVNKKDIVKEYFTSKDKIKKV